MNACDADEKEKAVLASVNMFKAIESIDLTQVKQELAPIVKAEDNLNIKDFTVNFQT